MTKLFRALLLLLALSYVPVIQTVPILSPQQVEAGPIKKILIGMLFQKALQWGGRAAVAELRDLATDPAMHRLIAAEVGEFIVKNPQARTRMLELARDVLGAQAVATLASVVLNEEADDLNVEAGDKDPSTPVGGSGPKTADIPKGNNEPAIIDGIRYGGHALDQMQGRGVPPSAVKDAIDNGSAEPDRDHPETRTKHVGEDGRITVITDNDTGTVITVIAKGPRP